MTQPVLDVRNLVKSFTVGDGIFDRLRFTGGKLLAPPKVVNAVNSVSLSIAPGEVLALVGESGCGKSTVAKTIARIHAPTSGEIRIDGKEVSCLNQKELRPVRRELQMIFQDPYASLNPRQRIKDIVIEPLRAQSDRRMSSSDIDAEAIKLLARVGLNAEQANRYPHQFSGGQRQRIGIARALSVRPKLIIADEPVSALDVSIQAQILNLMMDLRDEFGLSYLFVSHDLSVVHHIADRVAVMYLGFMVETASRDQLFATPRHPYTQALLSAAPNVDKALRKPQAEITGEVPSALNLPSGCCFRTRCPLAFARCAVERPALLPQRGGGSVACHLHDTVPEAFPT
ncbi:dipeptide ABC transporter ATP-binding protein [Ensifer sp. HO-A22]|uniref:Dipeptide ABC transporter ATP-binding protein n=1 Tax=Ensifer oleiphilus TaxID=2742698 RepID=A0A7Y6UPV4_9HYPH|nr:dipeptide ABC transporter ATP-binding protein [Ensifer oleiphilus]NVD41775.1 dipeptide ABC transporter ATP-binding protein [Ensifer oleiphilus]